MDNFDILGWPAGADPHWFTAEVSQNWDRFVCNLRGGSVASGEKEVQSTDLKEVLVDGSVEDGPSALVDTEDREGGAPREISDDGGADIEGPQSVDIVFFWDGERGIEALVEGIPGTLCPRRLIQVAWRRLRADYTRLTDERRMMHAPMRGFSVCL